MNRETTGTDKLLTLIMPVYNEGAVVIPAIATLFLSVTYPFKLLVVYDRENDPTIPVIRRMQQYFPDLHLVQNKKKKGLLDAIKTGLLEAETRYVGIWVSYHVDPFGILNKMIEKLENGCDLVSANRFTVDSKRARGNKLKKLLSYYGNIILNRIIGMPIADVTSSVKVYRKSLLDSLSIETEIASWAVNSELAIKAAIKGYRLGEVPLERRNINLIHGITKFSVLKQLPEYLRWLHLGWKNRKLIKSHVNDG